MLEVDYPVEAWFSPMAAYLNGKKLGYLSNFSYTRCRQMAPIYTMGTLPPPRWQRYKGYAGSFVLETEVIISLPKMSDKLDLLGRSDQRFMIFHGVEILSAEHVISRHDLRQCTFIADSLITYPEDPV